MNSFRSLINLPTLLVVALPLISCRSETKQETSDSTLAEAAAPEATTAQLNLGPAGISGEPLESLSSGAAETVFTSLPSEMTGINFTNPIDQSHPQKHLYASAVACGGVAIGDIDNDGWPDIFLTTGPKKNRLYRQTSPLKFEDITDASNL
ncbi:MAG: VCBS repeat-containing protein, partial [Akkermansiaceae bacterium]